MNKGTYGYPLPPSAPTRVAPPEWRQVKSYLTPGTYNDFVVPQNVHQVAAMVFGAGGNGGQMGFGMGGAPLGWGLASTPNTPSSATTYKYAKTSTAIYCGSGQVNNILKTTNGGASWTSVTSGATGLVSNLVAANEASAIVFVGTSGTGGYSLNDGTSWSSVTFNGITTATVLTWIEGSTFLCASATGELSISTNNGATWASKTSNFGARSIDRFLKGSGVWMLTGASAASAGISTSTDSGTTWTLRDSKFGTSTISNIAHDGASTYVAAGAGGKISYSTDSGATWTLASGTGATAFNDIVWDSTNSLFCVVNTSGVPYTSPNGVAWTARTAITGSPAIQKMAFGNGYIAATTSTMARQIIVSSDGGVTWTVVASTYTLPTSGPTSIYFANNGWYASNSSSGILASHGLNGGGGGGFAFGIIDVVPGQTLPTITVGDVAAYAAVSGTSSIGNLLSATGGSNLGPGGAGYAANLRAAATASGGSGGTGVKITYYGGGGGGAAGSLFGNGGNGGSVVLTTDSSSPVGSGGGGGLAGGHGGSNSADGSTPGAGGGGFGNAGADSVSGGGGGGGSLSAGAGSSGGSGLTCNGGAVGASGGTPTSRPQGSALLALITGEFDGAGSGGAVAASAPIQGSGLGGGGGGGAGGNSTSIGIGIGAFGAGGGGCGSNTSGASQTSINQGNGGFGGGGGGAPCVQNQSSASTPPWLTGPAGLGGVGGGGGGGGAGVGNNSGMTSQVGRDASTIPPAYGGNGAVILFWTEGY